VVGVVLGLGLVVTVAAMILAAVVADDGPATDTTRPATTSADATDPDETAGPDASGCPPDEVPSPPVTSFVQEPPLCLDPATTYSAVVETTHGSFTITLDAENAPVNVNNVVALARWGYYDGAACHRVITDFVVQCGQIGGVDTGPGYTVIDELPADGEYAEGVVAMANTGAPNSAGAQWFVIVGDQGAQLPPAYTIIGRVTDGYDTTVAALEALADPAAPNGVPTLEPIDIISVGIVEG
jgi:cyclophilin family peptidyl-prolyl cis-trans isomerase